MKFSELVYKRPDLAAAGERIEQMTAELRTDPGYERTVQLVLQADELSKQLSDMSTIASVRYSQDTRDEFYMAEQQYFAEAGPALEEKSAHFARAVLESPHRARLEQRFPKTAFINAEIATKIISPAVIDLLSQEQMLCIEYQKTLGAIMVEFRGEKLPVPKMQTFTASGERSTRREASEAIGKALAPNAQAFDDIFSKLVKLRNEIAHKLGFESFIQLGYMRMTRNCYGPEEVETFRRQVKRELVPLLSELSKGQAKRLGLDTLHFYDQDVLRTQGNPKPVITEQALYEAGVQMYREMTPETAEMINKMHEMDTFDLFSREGKMAGGYCTFLFEQGVPFIFANFGAVAGDVEVFTHEGGHAFNAYLCREQELPTMTGISFETAEVHSMGMEFLCWPYLERFYAKDAEIARLIHLISSLKFIPYGCLVDEFQHRVYANPEMSADERNKMWLELEREYLPGLEYDGVPFYCEGRRWQRQTHIYLSPFYYIDYCLAQTCALQVGSTLLSGGWQKAWDKYLAFTSLGNAFTFTELLDKTGFISPFRNGALTEIIASAREYIDKNIGAL